MTITKIIQKVNSIMNSTSYDYDELIMSMDQAITTLNHQWRIELPLITDNPEMVQPINNKPGTLVPYDYDALPDDFIIAYIVPLIASNKFTITEDDTSAQVTYKRAVDGLSWLSQKYYPQVQPGDTSISKDKASYNLLIEDTTDQVGDGHNNYGSLYVKEDATGGIW